MPSKLGKGKVQGRLTGVLTLLTVAEQDHMLAQHQGTLTGNMLRTSLAASTRVSRLAMREGSMWNVMIALQIVTMIVLPLLILLLIHPQVTVFYIMLLLMLPASLTFKRHSSHLKVCLETWFILTCV